MRSKDVLGRLGEDAAVRHCEALGWTILARNWRCPEGELDIVARDGGEIVAVEVKTRRSVDFGHPIEAVTEAKLARLWRLVEIWCREHRARGGMRVDIIGIVAPREGRGSLDHLRGVW